MGGVVPVLHDRDDPGDPVTAGVGRSAQDGGDVGVGGDAGGVVGPAAVVVDQAKDDVPRRQVHSGVENDRDLGDHRSLARGGGARRHPVAGGVLGRHANDGGGDGGGELVD